MARYQRATSLVANVWIDTQTGESFSAGDSPAYKRFKAWVDAGNIPDTTPLTVVPVPAPDTARAVRIGKLATQAKQALQRAALDTNGERTIATLFSQTLDGLAQLDPLPPDPVLVTLEAPPEAPTPPTAPPVVANAGQPSVRVQ